MSIMKKFLPVKVKYRKLILLGKIYLMHGPHITIFNRFYDLLHPRILLNIYVPFLISLYIRQ
jgi:hypothetical protein